MNSCHNIPRVVIGAVSSGCGKTTVVTGLLSALRQMGIRVQSYKIGPDYIDPGYHRLASGRPSHNIDTWLLSRETMINTFINTARDAELSVIEGVMGLYDGGNNGISSTAEIAKLLQAPVILVVDCKSMVASAGAIALGFKHYDPEVHLAGVILNRLGSENHFRMVNEAMDKLGIPVLGAVYRNNELVMPERHLGLLPVEENQEQQVIDKMGQAMEKQLNIAEIMQLAAQAPALVPVADSAHDFISQVIESRKRTFPDDFGNIRIGVARDDAFSFYYAESLAVLERLGAQIVEFSPLKDKKLPQADGLIFGGGFPEMFARELSSNESMLADIQRAAMKGMPVYAECGGYMYLSRGLTDFDGESYPMLGLLPTSMQMNKKLQMVGYVEATLQEDCILGEKGMKLRGHEFHFSSEPDNGEEKTENDAKRAFSIRRIRNNNVYSGGFINAKGNVAGSYLHIHFAGCPEAAAAFVRSCWNYKINSGW